MYIDDCLHGTTRIMESDILDPINLGSAELVTINQLVDIVEEIAGVRLKRRYNLAAPKGVRGRNSDNTRIREQPRLGAEHASLVGMEKTYSWIYDELVESPRSQRRSVGPADARGQPPRRPDSRDLRPPLRPQRRHGYNLHRRAALSLNCIAEVLTDPDDEIIFVDYNTPDELPTFIEAIADTLTDRASTCFGCCACPPRSTRSASRAHSPFRGRAGSQKRRGPTSEPLQSVAAFDEHGHDLRAGPDRSLSEICEHLADGYYGLPRFELPEWLWERCLEAIPAGRWPRSSISARACAWTSRR